MRLWLTLALAAGGCGGGGDGFSEGGDSDADTDADTDADSDADTDADTDADGPGLALEAADADCGSTIGATVTAPDFTLEEPTGQPNQAGHGHWAIVLDDADPADALATGFAADAEIPLPVALDAGDHVLSVVLVENDGTPVAPAARGETTLTVTERPCLWAVATPDELPAGESFSLEVEVGNFTLVDPGGPNVNGQGHYHVYFDGDTGANYLVADQVPVVAVEIPGEASAGPHTIRVALGENDHRPLSPPVEVLLDLSVR